MITESSRRKPTTEPAVGATTAAPIPLVVVLPRNTQFLLVQHEHNNDG